MNAEKNLHVSTVLFFNSVRTFVLMTIKLILGRIILVLKELVDARLALF
jgi:hypothetical protein